jgi:hypothetical protein
MQTDVQMQELESELRRCWVNHTFSTLKETLDANMTGFLSSRDIQCDASGQFPLSHTNGDLLVGFRVPIHTTVYLITDEIVVEEIHAKAGHTYFALFDRYSIPLCAIGSSTLKFEAACPTIHFIYYTILNFALRRCLMNTPMYAICSGLKGFKGIMFNDGTISHTIQGGSRLPRLDDLSRMS